MCQRSLAHCAFQGDRERALDLRDQRPAAFGVAFGAVDRVNGDNAARQPLDEVDTHLNVVELAVQTVVPE